MGLKFPSKSKGSNPELVGLLFAYPPHPLATFYVQKWQASYKERVPRNTVKYDYQPLLHNHNIAVSALNPSATRNQISAVQVMQFQEIGECSVQVNTSDASYSDNSWLAIPITLRDFSKQTITVGNKVFTQLQSSLSATAIQVDVSHVSCITWLNNIFAIIFSTMYDIRRAHLHFTNKSWRETLFCSHEINIA